MNQIQEKVKDLVDVRSSEQVQDFIADLAQTLSGYYFTDITSDLMSKWIDRVVVMPTGSGNSYALAGYRGVGKSHFLAAFGAILSQPDLRARLKDSHVFASAERLIRRHYPVIHVRRGTKPTLMEELQDALHRAFEGSADLANAAPADFIKFISEKGGAGPAVLIIDTDFERESRVSRDDGGILSEIAEAAEGSNVFVAVALDDDVATADGRNSGIVRSFKIDYLDHEHLYKIIDAHIFPKNNQKRAVITSLYENFRSVQPSFRWSEQRMASVYPLHPVILEVAPFVRLFIHDFALLGFASSAGAKVLNRPADSLIALDELFDTVEKSLRKAGDLRDVFAAYDSLNESVINKIPVLERLRAKLVLKGLMLLSLDSEGATASDIAAAMLIFDERDPEAAINFIHGLLEKLVSASDGRLWRMEREGRAAKYGFNLSGKEHFNTALSEAVQSVPDSVVPILLKRLMRDRYSDCEFLEDGGDHDVAETVIEWRGGVRKGRVVWNIGNHSKTRDAVDDQPAEWEILIDFEPLNGEERQDLPFIQWKPDALKPEEFDALKRYHALMSREDLQQAFRDEVRTAIQTYTIAIEKIWERKFLQYGSFVIDGSDTEFSASAAAGHNLAEVLSAMLTPYLEEHFPEHPYLGSRLEMDSVEKLSTGLFAAREAVSPEVRKLAEDFALPLGLADIGETGVEIRTVEGLLSLQPVALLMDALASTEGPVLMNEIHARLGARPFGLTFEAQCLILTALVARGAIEFVTKSGDRIGNRSLDLKLIWDDVAGITTPPQAKVFDDGLVRWAARLTGNDKLKSISSDAARKAVHDALVQWVTAWKTGNILEQFESIPDDMLTTELWHIGARVRKSYGVVVDALSNVDMQPGSLENALRLIQDAFSASEVEYLARSADVDALTSALRSAALRNEIRTSVGCFEATDSPVVESDRTAIFDVFGQGSSINAIVAAGHMTVHWNDFQANYNQYFEKHHESSSRSHEVRDRANEIIASHEWWIYENLANVEQFPTRFKRITKGILREIRNCNCTAAVSASDRQPAYCSSCGYSVKSDRHRWMLCTRLWETVNQAIVAYDHVLQRIKDDVIERAELMAKRKKDKIEQAAVKDLLEKLRTDASVAAFTEDELRAFMLVCKDLRSPADKLVDVEESITPVVTGEEIIEDVVVVH
jgi:hypothetical protein